MWFSLSNYLRQRARTAPWGKGAEASEVLARCASYCSEFFPPNVAARMWPVSYRDRVLTVAADHPAILQQLHQQNEALRSWCAQLAEVRRVRFILRAHRSGSSAVTSPPE